MIQRDTRRRITFRRLRTDGTETSCFEILRSPSDGLKNIVNVWIRSCQLISHIQLQGKSVKDMRTVFLSVLMVKDRSLDQWRKGQTSHTQWTKFSFWGSKWRIQIRISLKRLRFRQRPIGWRTAMQTMEMEYLVSIFLFLFNLVDATRLARRISVLSLWRKNYSDFSEEFRLQATALPFEATGGVTRTPHRASFTCNTHAVFLVCTWLKFWGPSSGQDRWMVVLASMQSHSISSMFHRTLLDPQLSPHFSTPFPTLALGLSTSPSLLSFDVSTATLHGGLCFGWLAEKLPLTGYEPKPLIEVSSEHTPINLPSKKGILDTNLDDLATTVDASEVYDTTDVGRLLSPLFFSGISADPFSVSRSQTHSSVEKSRRDVELFSSFGKPLSKGKRNRDSEGVQEFSNEKRKTVRTKRYSRLLWKESWSCFSRRIRSSAKIIWSAVWIGQEKNGECEMLILLFLQLACSSNPRGMETLSGNQLIDQTRREKSWVWDELETELFRKIVQEIDKKLKSYEEFTAQRLKELDNWDVTSFLHKRKKIILQCKNLWFRFRNCKTRWIP